MEQKSRVLALTALPTIVERALPAQASGAAPDSRRWPLISVIIPAHNEEAYLGETLQALRRQSYPRFESIVVANACSDQTALIAKGHCDRLVVTPRPGISHARNLGARLAQGEILLFLDADTILERDALEIVAEQFTREYASGTLKGKPDSSKLVFLALYALKNWLHRKEFHKGSMGVILCWKDYFEAAGGFEEALHVMENSLMIRRLDSFGKYRCIDDTRATTSMRRYEKTGFCRMSWLWVKYWIQAQRGRLMNKAYAAIR